MILCNDVVAVASVSIDDRWKDSWWKVACMD